MATGEQFIEEENREKIKAAFHPPSVDMESAAVAPICYVNQTPFVSVRTITDTFGHKGLAAFGQNCEKAAQLSADIVCAMLKALP